MINNSQIIQQRCAEPCNYSLAYFALHIHKISLALTSQCFAWTGRSTPTLPVGLLKPAGLDVWFRQGSGGIWKPFHGPKLMLCYAMPCSYHDKWHQITKPVNCELKGISGQRHQDFTTRDAMCRPFPLWKMSWLVIHRTSRGSARKSDFSD